ncbi:alkene reductase [Parablastomonas sp. CN1-191]|uniref:alkene reductase n=1 Tax=Parablastomonas sp. CN1-191 TaxID=3400908 RepID=UPI003BF7CFCF
MHEALFQPIRYGAIEAPNRIVMAPLTRGRADKAGVPSDLMIEYYRQRAGAGLIISEGTGISVEGLGWPFAPGIWTDAQVEAWKPVTEAVHAAGGRIACQLWHMGRTVHPDFLNGAAPISASATTAPDHAHTYEGRKPYGEARAGTRDDIARIIDDYGKAAHNARAAGFDAVQLHGANGYLIDQFLRAGTNLREDEYGGPANNRVRFLREVLERLVDVLGSERVGVRFSPNGATQGCDDPDPASVFGAAAKVCEDLDLAFVELRQPGPDGTFGRSDVPRQHGTVRAAYSGPLILNSDYDAATAAADIAAGICDAVSFGRPYISNPDLDRRIAAGAEFAPNKGVPQTWYTPGPVGYIDYPPMAG